MTTDESQQPARRHTITRVGTVDSVSGHKTVRVVINNLVKHPLYGKYMRRRTRLMAHDEREEARVGDSVEVARCRPISKRKAWRLVQVLKRSAEAEAQAGSEAAET